MRTLVLSLLLSSCLPSLAQTPSERFSAAEEQYAAHRSDGTTWDDGTLEAAQAIDAMWSSAIYAANDFITSHPGASTGQVKSFLESLTPVKDARFGNGLSADVIQLDQDLYAVAFNSQPASTIFVFRKGSPDTAWHINDASAQGKDTDNVLRAWRSDQADDKCRDRQPEKAWDTCGPLTSSVGLLPRSSTGAPRFYVGATYSTDAGASVEDQLSLWEWEGSAPALLWLHTYVDHLDSTRPIKVQGPKLSFGEQSEFKSFYSFPSSDGRQLLHEIAVGPEGIKDLGARALYPELDAVDRLIDAIKRRRPTTSLADRNGIQPFALAVRGNELGGLEDWSVMRRADGTESLCFRVDELVPWTFTFAKKDANPYFISAAHEERAGTKPCPKKGAQRKPYSASE